MPFCLCRFQDSPSTVATKPVSGRVDRNAFLGEQGPLEGGSAAEAPKKAADPNDAVARDGERKRIGREGISNGSRGVGLAQLRGDLAISADLAAGNPGRGAQDGLLEGRTGFEV